MGASHCVLEVVMMAQAAALARGVGQTRLWQWIWRGGICGTVAAGLLGS